MNSLRGIVAAALLLAAPATGWAGIEKAGTTAAGFLTVGAGADVLGMGGATLGLGNGLGAAAWNVAALGALSGTQYVFSHATVTGESPQDWVAAGGRFGASGTRWGLSGLYQGDGAFEGRDVNNLPTGSFSASSMALGVQVAQPVGPLATVGLGVKYASEKLGDVTGGGIAFDAGFRMQAGTISFGAAAQNAFGKMNYEGSSYDFPTSYGAGVAYSMPLTGLTFALDANFPTAYYSDVRGGVEWRHQDRVALRAGYRKELGAEAGEPLGGPTFGMGAGANGFWLDYGFLTGGASGSGQHRVGLTYRPGFMNGGSEAATSRPERLQQVSKPQPTYVDRAKAVRSSNPVTPKPAATPSRAPEVVASPAAPAATAKTVAPAKTSSTSTPDREPATPAVATPAPIKSTASKPEAPVGAKAATPATLEAAPRPAPLGGSASAKSEPAATDEKPAKAAKVEKSEKPEASAKATPETAKPATKSEPSETAAKSDATATPAKIEPTEKPAKGEEPAKAVKPEGEARPDASDKKLENAPRPEPTRIEESPKPAKPEREAPVTSRPSKVKVKSGQTLADIAKEWGNTVPALMMENNLVSEKVKSGQVLILPAKGR